MHSISIDKFVNNTVSFKRMIPFTEDNLNPLLILLEMIRSRSEKFPERASFAAALSNAYATKVNFGMVCYGPRILVDVRVSYIRQDYIDDPNYIHQVVDIVDQVLFHHLLNEETLEEALQEVLTRLKAAMDMPDVLALSTALEIAAPGTSISIPVQGTQEGLLKVTLEDVQNLYKRLVEEPVDAYFAGQIEPEMEEYVESLPQSTLRLVDHPLLQQEEVKESVIKKDVDSMNLVQLYATQVLPNSKDYSALVVMNSLLGTSPKNLLFDTLREKHSLCYSVGSSIIRYEGALVISGQFLPGALQQAKDLIQKQIHRLVQGEFSLEEMEIAKLSMINMTRKQEDSLHSLSERAFLSNYLSKTITEESQIQAIHQVSKEDVMDIAKRLYLVSECVVASQEALSSTQVLVDQEDEDES